MTVPYVGEEATCLDSVDGSASDNDGRDREVDASLANREF